MARRPHTPCSRVRIRRLAVGLTVGAVAGSLGGCTVGAVWRASRAPDTVRGARAERLAAARPDSSSCALPRTTAVAAGIAGPALDSLVAAARRSDGDAFLVLRDGAIVVEEYRTPDGAEKRHSVQSIAKALTTLTVGTLIDDGTLRSLDQPLGDFFPAWRDGDRGRVTLRMLLSHTSGVAAGRGELQLRRRRDALAWALAQPLAEPPGAVYRYNNVGNFLAGSAAAEAGGRSFGALAAERLFVPLCIDGARWLGDEAGHTFTYGALLLRGRDLARIGQLALDRGAWRGRQVVSAAYVNAVTQRDGGPRGGPLFNGGVATGWFVTSAWDSVTADAAAVAAYAAAGRARGAPDSAVRALESTAGRRVARQTFLPVVARALGLTWRARSDADSLAARLVGLPMPARVVGPSTAILHDGSGGQFLTIYPRSRLVLVRLRRATMGMSERAGFPGWYAYGARLDSAASRPPGGGPASGGPPVPR